MSKKKKKFLKFLIVLVTLLMFCAFVFFMIDLRTKLDIEYSVLVADHIFELIDNGQCDRWHFSDEEDFLNYCTDEEIAEIVKNYFQFDSVMYISDEVVIFRLQEPIVFHWGYAVVRNNVSLPNEEIGKFQTAKFKPVNDRVYSFRWFSM